MIRVILTSRPDYKKLAADILSVETVSFDTNNLELLEELATQAEEAGIPIEFMLNETMFTAREVLIALRDDIEIRPRG